MTSDYNTLTPADRDLAEACAELDEERARAALAGGASFESLSAVSFGRGRRPLLHYLISHHSYNLLGLALDNGADPEVRDEELDWTALYHAAAQDNGRAVTRLIQAGAHVEARCKGRTPLLAALSEKKMRAAEALLVHGANANVRLESGMSLGELEDDDFRSLLIPYGLERDESKMPRPYRVMGVRGGEDQSVAAKRVLAEFGFRILEDGPHPGLLWLFPQEALDVGRVFVEMAQSNNHSFRLLPADEYRAPFANAAEEESHAEAVCGLINRRAGYTASVRRNGAEEIVICVEEDDSDRRVLWGGTSPRWRGDAFGPRDERLRTVYAEAHHYEGDREAVAEALRRATRVALAPAGLYIWEDVYGEDYAVPHSVLEAVLDGALALESAAGGWHCPVFKRHLPGPGAEILFLWIEHPDPAERHPESGGKRVLVNRRDSGGGLVRELSSDDPEEGLRFVLGYGREGIK